MACAEGFKWNFSRGDGEQLTANIEIVVYLHDSPLEIVSRYFGYSTRFVAKNLDVMCMHSGLTAREYLDECEKYGTWGWCLLNGDERAVHVWYDKKRGHEELLPQLVATLAHEQGHMYGEADDRPLQEELRATGYELVTASSFDLAKRILAQDCGTTKSLVQLRGEILRLANRLQGERDSGSIAATCEDMLNALHELRGTVGAT